MSKKYSKSFLSANKKKKKKTTKKQTQKRNRERIELELHNTVLQQLLAG